MIKYKDWSPSVFDTEGLNLPEHQEWFVVPVLQTRDSGPLERANFACALGMLAEKDPGRKHHEDFVFSHWGPGWFNIILVDPTSPLVEVVERIEDSLADYPVLDEFLLSEYEVEDELESWGTWGSDEFLTELEHIQGAPDNAEDILDDLVYSDALWGLFQLGCDRSSRYPEHYSDGVSFPIKEAANALTWVDIESVLE